MKKPFIVIVIVQFVLMVMFLVYAMVQRQQAQGMHDRAIEFQKVAEENLAKAMAAEQEAMKQSEIVREQANLAHMNEAVAQKALEDCRKRR